MDQDVDIDKRNDEETSSSTLQSQQDSESVEVVFSSKAMKRQNSSETSTSSKMTKKAAPYPSERLEEVFQDEILKAFTDITGFEKFAHSSKGLCLDEPVIQGIVEDNKYNVEEQKLKMLRRWKQEYGEQATVSNIRNLVASYKRGDDPEDYISLDGGRLGLYRNAPLCKQGHVYLGEQNSEITGSYLCAIKLQPQTKNNLREAKILSKLRNHVNVVSILHAGIYRSGIFDYIFIAMDLSWTKSVRNMLEESDRLGIPFNEFISTNLVRQISKAVDFIHLNSIIHRDLKPENVLVSEDWCHSKVTDFEFSKAFVSGFPTKQTSVNIGTEGYRSAETYNIDVKITSKSDIFSLGVIIAEILANGKHPFGKDQYLWSHNIINNKNFDLSNLLVSNTAQVIRLIERMLEMDSEKRPTAEEVLNEILQFKTWSQLRNQQTTADQSSATTLMARLPITEKDKSYRGESFDATAHKETHTCFSDIAIPPDIQQACVNIQIKKHDCTLSNVEFIEIEKIIKLNSEVDMIEFCNCGIAKDYCTPGENKKNTAKCKISKLIISYTDNFKNFFTRFFCSTFGGCKIKSLCLVYANLDDQDVDNLQSFKVKGIESLDISYNKEITQHGFEQIGKMIAEQGIKTLKAINCDLEKPKLEKLFKGLKNVNLRELDIGYNDKLTENGFEMLAELVASRGIEILKLRGCHLTEKTIEVFYKKLEKTDKKRLLNELDVSYNREMNPAGCEILGLIIKEFGITTLNLAGCRISKEHLTSLMSMKDIKLHALNLSDNSYPGNSMVEIEKIVSEFKIQELDISDCMFSVSELKNFSWSGIKLLKLHLGDKSCELGMKYIHEVCQLLPTVKEMLYLRFHRLDDSCRRLLKEQSEKLSVSIQLCDEPRVTSDK